MNGLVNYHPIKIIKMIKKLLFVLVWIIMCFAIIDYICIGLTAASTIANILGILLIIPLVWITIIILKLLKIIK